MNKKITAAFLALLTLGMVASAAAQQTTGEDTGDVQKTQSSNVTVNVTSTTAIDVKPDTLDYSNMDVGEQNNQSDRGFTALEIENIGSEYIDRVWAEASSPDSDGFATGNASQYNAGNFIQIKPNNATEKASVTGDSDVYNFINRYEYGDYWTQDQGSIPSYIEASPGEVDGGSGDTIVGRFRSGDQWYFWVIPVNPAGTVDGQCNGGNTVMRVGNDAHSPSNFGSYDFTDGSGQFTEYTINATTSSSPDYGVASSSPSGIPLDFNSNTRYYDVLTACDESDGNINQAHTVRTRYNPTAATADDLEGNNEGNAAQFLLSADSTTPSEMLLPGEGITVDTAVEVPQGVAEGQVGQGQATFYVTSDVSEDSPN